MAADSADLFGSPWRLRQQRRSGQRQEEEKERRWDKCKAKEKEERGKKSTEAGGPTTKVEDQVIEGWYAQGYRAGDHSRLQESRINRLWCHQSRKKVPHYMRGGDGGAVSPQL